MKNLTRFLILSIVMGLIVALGATTVGAQDDEVPGPGEGGAVIRGNTRGSANLGSLVWIRCDGVDCSDPGSLIWPSLLALDPVTQNYSPDLQGQGQVANGWSISDDGTVYTFTLREDAFWTDGQPITAEDFYFAWDATQNGEAVGMSSSYSLIQRDVVNAEIVDDYTIAFTMREATCNALSTLAFNALPAHAYNYSSENTIDYDWGQLVGHPFDTDPTVTSGPFNFFRADPGTAILLSANPDYWDNNGEYTIPEGWVYVDVLDETVLVERFLSGQEGEPNLVFEPTANFGTLRDAQAQGFQYFESPGRIWHYMALNHADPSNPVNGLEDVTGLPGADNLPLDQGNHPLFGDVRVRQAIQYAINIDEIINGALSGDATPMVSGTIPTAFTIHPTLERRPYDVDAARALLDEAGFVSTGDPIVDGGDGLRTCQGCLYADEGTPFVFQLDNPGGPRNDVAILVQAQLARLGIEVNVQSLDFNTLYDNRLGAQVFDAAIAGWRGGLPFDPDQRNFFGAQNDLVDDTGSAGFNYTSWYNERFEELGEMVNQVVGCDVAEQQAIAYEMQEIMWEEQPYVWLYALNTVYAAAPNVEGFAPYPSFGDWNVDAWVVNE
ncbi:MAG: ABC transporter substrate-binding protein [Aggregatilineales bacterium]